FLHEFENAANILFVGEDGGSDDRLFDSGDLALRWPARRIVDVHDLAVSLDHVVTYARRGGDQLQTEFALHSLLDDLHVQQAEKAAAEAEAQRRRAFRLEEERGIVESKFFEGLAQRRVFVSVHSIEPGKNHGLDFLEAGQGLDGRTRVVGDSVTDFGIGYIL